MSAKPPVPTSDWLPEVEGLGDSERAANQPIGPSWPEALAPEAFHL